MSIGSQTFLGTTFFSLLIGASVSFASEGDFDSTFNTNGIVQTSGFNGSYAATAVQADGKILYASKNNQNHQVLLRYNSDGSFDASFGSSGKVETSSPDSYSLLDVVAIEVQPDQKIIVIGKKFDEKYNYRTSITRYKSDGFLDSTFGTNGFVVTAVGIGGDFPFSGALQPDGKILVGEYSIESSDVYTFNVLRYTSNGVLDTSFNHVGYTNTDLGSSNLYNNNSSAFCGITVQSDGKILFTGSAGTTGDNRTMIVIRYKTDGSLDSTFNAKGYTNIASYNDQEGAGAGVAQQSDGKIVVVGQFFENGWYAYSGAVRLNSDGSLDPTFGNGGYTQFGSGYCGAEKVKITRNGKIITGGWSYNYAVSSYNISTARLNADGSLDQSFGNSGYVDAGFIGGDQANGYDLALQADNKIIVATSDMNFGKFITIRYKQKNVPNVTAWPTASSLTYGDHLSTSTLSSGVADVAGSFVFADTSLPAKVGDSVYAVNFIPTDTAKNTIVSGSITVICGVKTLTISGASAANKKYDGTLDALISGEALVGALDGDRVSLADSNSGSFAQATLGSSIPVTTTASLVGADAWKYTLQQSVLSADIQKATVTVTPDSLAKSYGSSDPTLTYTATGLIGADALSGALARDAGENTGKYAIQIGTLAADSNYSIKLTDKFFIISKYSTKVTAWPTASSLTYGDHLSTSTLSSGVADVAGSFVFADTSLPAKVGDSVYAVNFIPTDTAKNTIVSGSITVICGVKTLTISGASAANKKYDGTLDALISGEALVGALDGDRVSLADSNSGSFAQATLGSSIPVTTTASLVGADAWKYTLQQSVLSADIQKATVTVTPDSLAKSYGSSDPTLTYTATGLIGADALSGALARDAGENVGKYAIQIGTLAADSNYSISLIADSLSILKAAQTIHIVMADTVNMSNGINVQVTSSATSGLTVVFTSSTPSVCTVSGDTISLVSAGTCTVTASQDGNSNYEAAPSISASLSVEPPSAVSVTNKLRTNSSVNSMQVFSLQGRLLWSGIASEQGFSLPESLPAGRYVVTNRTSISFVMEKH